MSAFDFIRFFVIISNLVLFGLLAIHLFSRARRSSSRARQRLRFASGAACLAVAVGGVQRVVLQAVHLELVSEPSINFVLEDQALVQALVVAALGVYSWRALNHAESDVMTAESLLAAFGREVADVDWSSLDLTRRQEEILRLVGRGVVSDAAIAEELSISTETARSHVKAVMGKAGVTSRLELAVAIHSSGDHPTQGGSTHQGD